MLYPVYYFYYAYTTHKLCVHVYYSYTTDMLLTIEIYYFPCYAPIHAGTFSRAFRAEGSYYYWSGEVTRWSGMYMYGSVTVIPPQWHQGTLVYSVQDTQGTVYAAWEPG